MLVPRTLERESVEFEQVGTGLYCTIHDHSVIAIRDQEKLERVWADFWRGQPGAAPTMPEVNFDTEMLICSCRGRFATTGFTTTIKRVIDAKFRGGRFLWVVIAEHDPRGMTRQDFTSPWHIIRLPKSNLNVRPFFYRSRV